MHPYLRPLAQSFEANQNPALAEPMARYMRNHFSFLGLKSVRRRELLREFWAAHGLPPTAELPSILHDLWALEPREFQYAGLDLLDKTGRQHTADFLDLFQTLITTKSWWDTVDALASHAVGRLCRRFPPLIESHIGRWRTAENIWLRRTTLLFQLGYKEGTNANLLFALIRENLDSKEFFIQKAIGWGLREYSKSDAAAVTRFVAETPLPPLSQREALKWLNSHQRA